MARSTFLRRRIACLAILLVLPILAIRPAAAQSADDGLCQRATAQAERMTGVPDQLLGAISRIESGRYDPTAGSVRAWPWTINAQGVGHYYNNRQDAVAAARAFQAAGIQSIDVGCMQINLMFHPDGFASLDQAFDPSSNALFAARFLTDLFHQTGSWPHAAAAYHSQTPNLGSDYQRKVLEAWAEPTDRPSAPARPASRPANRSAMASNGAIPGAGAAPALPMPAGGAIALARPLGGFGHIIRSQPAAMSAGIASGFPMGSLAAYRARPVRMASLPPSGLR